MKTPPRFVSGRLLAAALLLAGLTPVRADLITGWTFNNDTNNATTGFNTAPVPSTGTGTSASLGFNGTTYNTTPSVDNSAVFTTTAAADQGSSDPIAAASNIVWRVRGNNGWSTNAPVGTQGAQFSLATTGFNNIQVQFDWYATTAGPGKLQVQYTTNGGATYANAPAGLYSATSYASVQGGTTSATNTLVLTNSTSANTVAGSFLQSPAQGWTNGITLNLSGIAAANNNAGFGVRFVNAATGADDVNAAGTAAASNTAGNWRFDQVNITGALVPEPGTLALAGIGLAGLAALALRRKSTGSREGAGTSI